MSATSRFPMNGVKVRDLAIAAACSLGASTACLSPPPAGGAATPAAPAAAEPAAAGAPSAPVAAGSQTALWNGEDAAAGKSWADCDKKDAGCKATLTVAEGEGSKGSNALKLHGEGPGWQGCGWNWHGWWPENAGTDITGYDTFTISVKVTGASKEKTPQASGINVSLRCSKDKKTSADAALGKYVATAADGQWHEVTIPLNDFFGGKGAECDAHTAWEFGVGTWSGTEMNYDILIDDVAVKKK